MAGGERRQYRRATWVNVIGNAVKIAVEGSVGLLFGSVALLADAAHSVADLVASLIVLIWGDRHFDEPDLTHPHGHARFEPMSALTVGSAIVLMGGLLLYESGRGLFAAPRVIVSPALVVALVIAIALMVLVWRYTVRVNATLGSPALRALAVDCRNDVLTSCAALVGIVGVMAGYLTFDAIAGAVVSLLVIGQGIVIVRENLTYLTGRAAPSGTQEAVRTVLLDHPDVAGVHDLVVYYDGALLEAEAHVEVDGDIALRRAHDIESELVQQLREIEEIGDAHVHLDPSGLGEWKDANETSPS